MVHRDEEDGLVIGKSYQPATDEWTLLQSKWRLRFFGQQFLKRFLTISYTTQIVGDQMETAVLGGDLLQCLSIDQREGRAQRCMPGHDAIQRTL